MRVESPPKTQNEIEQEAKDRQERALSDRRLLYVSIAQAMVFLLQLMVFGYQALKLRETVRAAAEQSLDTKASIAQATRAAAAMENVAAQVAISAQAATESVAITRERSVQQMRAYLTVQVGEAVYQERHVPLRFEGKPALINTGHTPAHNVAYIAKAAILPVALPDDFQFPLTGDTTGGAVLGPQQAFLLSAIVDEFVDDAAVEDIKHILEKGLYVWGRITYEDVFGESRKTKFALRYQWTGKGIFAIFLNRHNEAD